MSESSVPVPRPSETPLPCPSCGQDLPPKPEPVHVIAVELPGLPVAEMLKRGWLGDDATINDADELRSRLLQFFGERSIAELRETLRIPHGTPVPRRSSSSPSVPTAAAPKLDPITDYWFAHYVNENMCSLCAQSGIIDTTAKRTPAGLEVGRRNFCICPNGQSLRARVQGEGV